MLPKIELTQQVYQKHLANMERIMQIALEKNTGWDVNEVNFQKKWDLVATTNDWNVYTHKKKKSLYQVHEYIATGTMKTTIEALQEAFYVRNTQEFRALMALLHEEAALDAALLNITHRRTVNDPGQFFGVKYLKLNAQLVNQDDQEIEYFYLEFAGTRVDALGRLTYFIITEPVAIRSLDDSIPSHVALGERCATVKLYREGVNGTVDVFIRSRLQSLHQGQQKQVKAALTRSQLLSAKMKESCFVFWKSMGVFIPDGLSRDFLALHKESSAPEARRLATGLFTTNWRFSSKLCIVCQKSFNLFRRKSYCRRCGEAACKSCSISIYCIDRPTQASNTNTLAKETFCKACFVAAKVDVTQGRKNGNEVYPDRTTSIETEDGSSSLDSEFTISQDIVQLDSPGRDEHGHCKLTHFTIEMPHKTIDFFPSDSSSSHRNSIESNAISIDENRPRRYSGESSASSVFEHMNALRQPRKF
ncbi:hypothetical protein THRCLA_02664 [Thraustotheca clavata]|uniref:FYVE-type domain-containing protein n=1 Tax=Thraustotheca clavata TaxID=74557 RepID=A0A1W0A554_9STRA|nr:hypothetical protein THRCLA_02664 [Thraustotheca clavata]